MTQETNVKLKLLIDSKSQSVLYGEANKDFIDYLFNLLSLPLGAVIRLLKKENMVGCLGNLYESVETLSETCFLPNQTKDTILKPQVSFNCPTKLLPYVIEASSITSSSYSDSSTSTSTSSESSVFTSDSYFRGGSGLFGASTVSPILQSSTLSSGGSGIGASVSPFNEFRTPSFGGFGFGESESPLRSSTPSFFCIASPFGRESTSVKSTSQKASTNSGGGGEKVGYVKGLATYIVMDDLTVKQISDFSIVSLLKKFNIKDVDSLEEKVITLNVDEGVELLKASLQSKMVLTNVFLRRERQIIDNNDIDNNDNDNDNDNDFRMDNQCQSEHSSVVSDIYLQSEGQTFEFCHRKILLNSKNKVRKKGR